MKKLLFLLLLLFSCEKETQIKDTCWLCIDKYGVQPENGRFETCDVLVAIKENGSRWQDRWGTWHLITCTEIK